ncbi:hypothetical protein [Fictibacillus sp. 18YEL24]|nr:hypothetical protein [Fictibacillus sp. 18YEL24]
MDEFLASKRVEAAAGVAFDGFLELLLKNIACWKMAVDIFFLF